jgi:BlaI family penicillinase repressor
MTRTRTIDLTRRESQIMDTLHRKQGATVEDVRGELPDAPSPSSVRKLLEIMIERGLVRREYDGPRFVYFPTASPEAAGRSALQHLVRTFFNDSPGSAMAALLENTSSPLSDAEYRRLHALLKQVRETGDKR